MDEFHEQTEGEVGGRVLRNLASGGRKFGLGLCLAHQGEYQDPLTTKAAMGNCYTKVAFAVNTDELEREFRIMEWKEVNFDAQPAWVKEGTGTCSTRSRWACRSRAGTSARRVMLGASRLSRGAKSGSAGTASRSRGRLRDGSRRVLA